MEQVGSTCILRSNCIKTYRLFQHKLLLLLHLHYKLVYDRRQKMLQMVLREVLAYKLKYLMRQLEFLQDSR